MQPIRVREITNDEGNRLLRIVRRGDGSVVTWRRTQITDHPTHRAQVSLIRRYIAWRNHHADDQRLANVVTRAKRCLTRHQECLLEDLGGLLPRQIAASPGARAAR